MHGKVPRLRAQRPKPRASASLPPQQRCRAALDLIQPVPKLRAECEAKFAAYVKAIRNTNVIENEYLAVQKLKPLRTLIKKLYAAERAGTNYLSTSLLKKLKAEREFLERDLKWLSTQRQHGGERRSIAKERATISAWILLEQYSRTLPTKTEGGTWHRLAAILFGCAEVDAFSFDYLKHSPLQKKKADQV